MWTYTGVEIHGSYSCNITLHFRTEPEENRPRRVQILPATTIGGTVAKEVHPVYVTPLFAASHSPKHTGSRKGIPVKI